MTLAVQDKENVRDAEVVDEALVVPLKVGDAEEDRVGLCDTVEVPETVDDPDEVKEFVADADDVVVAVLVKVSEADADTVPDNVAETVMEILKD